MMGPSVQVRKTLWSGERGERRVQSIMFVSDEWMPKFKAASPICLPAESNPIVESTVVSYGTDKHRKSKASNVHSIPSKTPTEKLRKFAMWAGIIIEEAPSPPMAADLCFVYFIRSDNVAGLPDRMMLNWRSVGGAPEPWP